MPAIDEQTPHVGVIDNRNLSVREVAYWRRDASELKPESRVTAQQYDAAGRLVAQRDPRFLAPGSRPNTATVYSLSGTALCTENLDAGWRLGLPDGTGQMREHWDGRGSHWQHDYDVQRRLTAVHEHMQGLTVRTVERLTYADNAGEFAERNQCGQLIRHDDRAGAVWLDQQALSGGVVRQRRRFLPDQCEVHPHWPVVEAERDTLLQPGVGYTTTARFGSLGQVLEQTDAGSHRKHFSLDRAGQLQRIDLTLESQGRQPLLKAASYNAEGQLLTQLTGNDVTSSATYEAAGGQLERLTAITSAGVRLQDLRSEYDPVGNILRLLDHTQPITFFANQRVEAANTFSYDSLYQLTCATGRETVNAGQPPGLPELIIPSPIDPGRLLNYTEYYEYDAGGNRTGLRHVSDRNPLRQQLRVDPHSNRALPWNEGDDEPDFLRDFDANGNLQRLVPGAQAMNWDALNQLQSVTTVRRPTAADDGEGYRYSAGGERVVKFSAQQGRAVTHRRVVHYLPGLEVRTTDDDEELQVICVPLARGSVRCLHWVKGKPDDIDADQLRYSVDDHVGSCSLELDKDAGVISHEGYYPFGGTAWWAARSRVDADHKTIRYSGKEQDACGLYYYGFRYYAPWLGRWVNPDPAGDVDGLNRYGMVGNNPIVYRDSWGTEKKPINKDIHMIWIGEAPEKLAAHIANINNTVKQASGYKVHLYLETAIKDRYSKILTQLNVHDIIYLRDSELFNEFQKTEISTLYNDFRLGDPKNLAYVADTLRPFIVYKLGGMYSDVDDIYLEDDRTYDGEQLGNTPLMAEPDELITHEPVYVSWQGELPASLIPNSSFAAHAGNSILKDVMDEMTLRYTQVVNSGRYSKSGGYIGQSILEKNPDDRPTIMGNMVGPLVYTDVILRHDEQVAEMLSLDQKIQSYEEKAPMFFYQEMTYKMPLGRYIQLGNNNSWK
ncbi:insecticidal toxin complex protein TccC [Pseudomonas sp. IT-P171]|uniref:RHS repeat-associated core domain-containing protein n=1 Tax=Pseudomonas sp. IT-P171 TaxID=3026453 RepID=UPI0039E14EE9